MVSRLMQALSLFKSWLQGHRRSPPTAQVLAVGWRTNPVLTSAPCRGNSVSRSAALCRLLLRQPTAPDQVAWKLTSAKGPSAARSARTLSRRDVGGLASSCSFLAPCPACRCSQRLVRSHSISRQPSRAMAGRSAASHCKVGRKSTPGHKGDKAVGLPGGRRRGMPGSGLRPDRQRLGASRAGLGPGPL